MSSNEKRAARDLQARTGWTYSECLRCIRNLSATQTEALILERASSNSEPIEKSSIGKE